MHVYVVDLNKEILGKAEERIKTSLEQVAAGSWKYMDVRIIKTICTGVQYTHTHTHTG